MRFAQESFLYLSAIALLLLGLFGLGALRLHKSRLSFGSEARILALLTSKSLARRTTKAVLASSAVFFALLAAAEPQYGKGTRVLPATNLDVAVVLDYSKSMYARDVAPYRMSRAKTEVLRLIDRLTGARFGAVAFAGEPISYPLTSDAAAIKQFFRSFDPNDMAVGGTAIARALDSAKDLLVRDPKSQNHEKIIVLVTDGEDLEGDPVAVAETAKAAGIQIHVVQIGGKSPEPIPEVDPSGKFLGYRKDASGAVLTTALTTEGEAQLRSVAESTGGTLTLAAKGEVGIDSLSERLRSHMTEELSEKVETVYADVFEYPLALALLLLLVEGFLGTAAYTPPPAAEPRGQKKRRKPRRLAATAAFLAATSSLLGCDPVDRLFTRKSPVVESAVREFREKRFSRATELLGEYLETGECKEGVIGAGERAKKHGDASFDLALSLGATVAETKSPGLGAPPSTQGAPAPFAGGPPSPGGSDREGPDREKGNVDCALRLLSNVADDPSAEVSLRAAALYLMGNLEMKRGGYKQAVTSFDRALLFAPGAPKERNLDPLGIDIAHNRALALRLAEEEEKKKDEEKKKNESSEDKKDEKKPDESKDDEKKPDESKDNEKKPDESKDEKKENEDNGKDEPKDEKKSEDSSKNEEKGAPPSPPPEAKDDSASQDQRILDLLEQAPTLQEQEAKNRARARVRRTMEDK